MCSGSGTYAVTADVSSLLDGVVTSTSTIDDGTNPPVSDVDTINKDTVLPTIDIDTPMVEVTAGNVTSYPVT